MLGDLLRRRSDTAAGSLLRIACTALKAHEARIARERSPKVTNAASTPGEEVHEPVDPQRQARPPDCRLGITMPGVF